MIATRQPMHGPLWTVQQDNPYRYVQLWAPNHDRDHWSVGWTKSESGDEDDTNYDTGFEKAATLGEIPALVPQYLSKMVGTAINAAQLYNPNERCTHVKAQSYSVRADGQVCGYCGRLYQPEPDDEEEPAGIPPETTPLVLSSEPTSGGAIPYVYDDGGRADAGYTGHTGDCVTRAIAIATGLPYQQVYDDLFAGQLARPNMARLELRYGARARSHASPRNGVPRKVYDPYLADLGWAWTPTMTIGSGTKVHVCADELPGGRLILRLSRHLAAVIDGVLHDTHDCSREGTRAVYGIWSKP